MKTKSLAALACPICHGNLKFNEKENWLICEQDQFAFVVNENIPNLLAENAISLKNLPKNNEGNHEI